MDDAIRERALEEGRGLGDVIRVLIVLGAARLKQPLEITPRRN